MSKIEQIYMATETELLNSQVAPESYHPFSRDPMTGELIIELPIPRGAVQSFLEVAIPILATVSPIAFLAYLSTLVQ